MIYELLKKTIKEFGNDFFSFSDVICEIDEDIFGSKITLTAVVCLIIV